MITDFLTRNAESIVTNVVLVLIVLAGLVLLTALLSRWRAGRRDQKQRRVREILGALIIQFVSGDLPIQSVQKHLKSKMDFFILMELIQELAQTLDGKEEVRLQELMEEPDTRNYYLKRFRSGDPLLQAKACLYFSRRNHLSRKLVLELTRLSAAPQPVLAYSATIAVVVHGRIQEKREALWSALNNPGISEMAVSDLMFRFTEHGEEYHQKELEVFAGFIESEKLPQNRRALLIRVLDELEYFHSIEFLKSFYMQLDKKSVSPDILDSLIRVLTKFGIEEILEDIHQHFVVYPSARIRESAAWSMGFFLKEESIPYLKWLVNDRDYNVRFQAARSICSFPDLQPELISTAIRDREEWIELIREIKATI